MDNRIVFVVLVIAMLTIAAGHLLIIDSLTGLYAGVPLWLWVQLVVVAVLFGMAWLATGVISANGDR